MLEKLALIAPGKILLEEFFKPMDISQDKLAAEIGVSSSHVIQIIRGKMKITADIASKLSCYLGTSAQFWINLQNQFDIENSQ